MKCFTFPSLLAAALFSMVVVIPFLPAARNDYREFRIEIQAASSTAGKIKIYYDVGRGYIESDSSEQVLTKSETPQLYRLELPSGEYRSIRYDPIDGPGMVTLSAPIRIVAASGRVVRTIGFSELSPLQLIESARVTDGRLQITTTEGANDPQLRAMFSPPIVLAPTPSELLAGILPRALTVFALVGAALWLASRGTGWQTRLIAAGRRLAQRPARAIAGAAAVAVIASAYPVVFLGKSYVSPNFGTTLLYEAYPSLPGYTDGRTSTAHGSDVGAVMWAHVPYAFMQQKALAKGELPLWNRYTVGGVPLLAQGQSMFGDPLHGVVLLGRGAAWAWDLKYLAAKWLFAAGLGLLVLAVLRSLSAPERAAVALPTALLVTFVAPFIGFYVYRINHPAVFTLGYAPWVLLCWIRVAGADNRRAATGWLAALFAANVSLLSSGTAKEAMILILALNATGASVLLASGSPWRARLAKLAGAAWAGALGLLITAPAWATFLRGLQDGFTGSSNPAAAQIQPALLLGAFDELFFRPLSQGEVVFNPSLNLFLLLGVLYFLATIRLQFTDRIVTVIVAATGICMAFVFGLIPVAWIVRIPFLGNIGHIENCFLCVLLVLWSVLAGIGFATAAGRLRTAAGRGDLAIVFAWLAAITFAWIAFRQVSHREVYGPGTTFSVLPQGSVISVSPFVWGSLAASLLACVALGVLARQAFFRGAFGPGRAVVALTCVVLLCWRHGLHDFAAGFESYVVRPPARADFRAKSSAIEVIQARQEGEPARVLGLHGTLTAGWNAAYGLETIYGADALQNSRVRELIDVSPVPWSSLWRVYLAGAAMARAQPFLDALNVRYYVDMPPNPDVANEALPKVHASDLVVYESKSAWPRAFFTDRLDVYDTPADLMKKFLASNGRPFAAVHAGDRSLQGDFAKIPRDMTTRTVTPARNYRLGENTTSFEVRASGPGIIVLHEGWWPGSFRVDVDGRRVPIVRVNHAFKGIHVPDAGNFRVTFSYWPRHFTTHLSLCAAGALLAAVSLVLGLRSSRPRTPASPLPPAASPLPAA